MQALGYFPARNYSYYRTGATMQPATLYIPAWGETKTHTGSAGLQALGGQLISYDDRALAIKAKIDRTEE
jgi:hypothetical protein